MDNADLKDRLLRALAEVENMRRRSERDVADASKYAISKFAKDMIAVADNMERAVASVPQAERERDANATAVLHGIELTAKAMRDALARNGIEKLEPVGHRFDPNFHEAMFEVVDPSKPNGTVADVLEPGYSIGSRPLRPAKVAVTRDKPLQ
ncbi:nucleotide exchange factor GrpE [Rhodopseudomonas boonkerdii]|uniref:nucleotide exchange factor GrpE n=1 Tax=Rhodopseudomonas boonkerdii TaxID=475937 RepID=UPI001E5089DD